MGIAVFPPNLPSTKFPAVVPSRRKAEAPPATVEVQISAPTSINPSSMAVQQKNSPEKSSLGTKASPMLIDEDDEPSQDHPFDSRLFIWVT